MLIIRDALTITKHTLYIHVTRYSTDTAIYHRPYLGTMACACKLYTLGERACYNHISHDSRIWFFPSGPQSTRQQTPSRWYFAGGPIVVRFYLCTEFEASKVAINGQYSVLIHPALLTALRQWLFVSRFPSSQLNKANSFDSIETEARFLILDMSITNSIVY